MALFKINPVSMFSAVIADADTATAIAGKATNYVVVAQQIGNAWGLSGPQKLAAVKAMLLADLQQSWPAGADWVNKAWPEISGVISALVSIFNTIGWMFQAAAPIIAAADPGAVPAMTAVQAALTAAQGLEKAAGTPTTPPAVVSPPPPTPPPPVPEG